MRDERVLITTYPTAFLHRGGGEIELIDLMNSLRQLGVRADLYGPQSLPFEKYDTLLHYSLVPTGGDFLREAKRLKKRTLLMPSVWWAKPPSEAERQFSSELLGLADQIIVRSKAEQENITQFLDLEARKVVLCRWGIDSSFDEPVTSGLFKQTYQLDDYLLWVGLIDEKKNQLSAIKALKHSKMPIVFIGDYRDRKYYEACVSAAPAHFKFLPHMQAKSEILRAAMRECKAYIELSLEPAGLSALEASLANVPMVLSRNSWTDEHFGALVYQADPLSEKEIVTAVEAALASSASSDLARNTRVKYMLPQSMEPLVRSIQTR